MTCACARTAATLLRATQGRVELAREAVRAETRLTKTQQLPPAAQKNGNFTPGTYKLHVYAQMLNGLITLGCFVVGLVRPRPPPLPPTCARARAPEHAPGIAQALPGIACLLAQAGIKRACDLRIPAHLQIMASTPGAGTVQFYHKWVGIAIASGTGCESPLLVLEYPPEH